MTWPTYILLVYLSVGITIIMVYLLLSEKQKLPFVIEVIVILSVIFFWPYGVWKLITEKKGELK